MAENMQHHDHDRGRKPNVSFWQPEAAVQILAEASFLAHFGRF